MYECCHMMSVFLCLTYFLSIIISRSVYATPNGTISFFFMAEQHSIVYMDHLLYLFLLVVI